MVRDTEKVGQISAPWADKTRKYTCGCASGCVVLRQEVEISAEEQSVPQWVTRDSPESVTDTSPDCSEPFTAQIKIVHVYHRQ